MVGGQTYGLRCEHNNIPGSLIYQLSYLENKLCTTLVPRKRQHCETVDGGRSERVKIPNSQQQTVNREGEKNKKIGANNTLTYRHCTLPQRNASLYSSS